MKPSDWGGDSEEDIKVLSTDEYDTCIKEYERKKGIEPPFTARPKREQLTLFLRKIISNAVDRVVANAPGVHFPAVNLVVFKPGRKSSRTD